MNRRRKDLVLGLALVAAAGCSVTQEAFRVDPATTEAGLTGKKFLWFGEKINPLDLDTFEVGETTLKKKNYVVTAAERNTVIGAVLDRSNKICGQHLADAFGTATSVNFLGTWLGTLFSGAAAAVTGGAAQTALSGAATASVGSTAVFNSKVYQDFFIGSILNTIEEDRATRRAAIESKLARNETQYPLRMALAELAEYHQRCSFFNGLVLMHEAVAKQKDTPERLLEQASRLQTEIDRNTEAQNRVTAGSAAADRYQKIIDELASQKATIYSRLGQRPR